MFQRQGKGFGFRGSSPAWPYAGRGRGGLPRCAQPGLYHGMATGTTQYPVPADNELGRLKTQASRMKGDIADIERRIQELENQDN